MPWSCTPGRDPGGARLPGHPQGRLHGQRRARCVGRLRGHPHPRCVGRLRGQLRGLSARVCYVRVGVGSIVPPPTQREQVTVRDNELSWVSVASRGLDESHSSFQGTKSIRNLRTKISSVGTKQQSRLKYSHSLMSIPFAFAAKLLQRQLEPSLLDSQTDKCPRW